MIDWAHWASDKDPQLVATPRACAMNAGECLIMRLDVAADKHGLESFDFINVVHFSSTPCRMQMELHHVVPHSPRWTSTNCMACQLHTYERARRSVVLSTQWYLERWYILVFAGCGRYLTNKAGFQIEHGNAIVRTFGWYITGIKDNRSEWKE